MITIIAILLLGTRALVGTHSGVLNLDFSDNFVSENSAHTEHTHARDNHASALY